MNNKKVDTVFLRDIFKNQNIVTDHLSFTDMKDMLKKDFGFKGKLTRLEITDHMNNYVNIKIKPNLNVIKKINEVKKQVNKIVKEYYNKHKIIKEVKNNLKKAINLLEISKLEIRNTLNELRYIEKYDGTIQTIKNELKEVIKPKLHSL